MPKVTWGVGAAEWEAFVGGCPDATFFHGPGWYQALAEREGYLLDAALFRFSNGHEALLPLAVGRAYRGLVASAAAGLENGYGGLVSPWPLSPDQVEAAYRLALRRYPNLTAVGNPHGQPDALPAGGWQEWDGTRVVGVRDPEAQAAALVSMRARHLKAARRAGFRVEVVVAPSEAQVARFYPLYALHAAQWRYTRWVRDEPYFHALLRRAGRHLVLYLAWADDELAGFHLVAEQGAAALQLHLATDPAFNRQNPGTLLVMEALANAYAGGFAAFDFLPSGRLETVQAFKESFGARPLPFARTTHHGNAVRLLRGAVQAAGALRPLVAS